MRFRSNPNSLRGSFGALITPFGDEGELDLEALTELATWQLGNGCHGLSVGGSTAEPSAQTFAERCAAIEAIAKVTADQVPFIPAIGTTKLDETLELTAIADEAGADAVLVITPYYARPTQQGLIEWYGRIASEFPHLPIVVYNVPSRTAVDMAPSTVYELRRSYDNIVGIKETTKDFEHFSYVLKLCGRDFMMWSGIELLCIPLLALGGAGFISALSNLAPRSLAEMYEHWTAGRLDDARDIHYELHPLADLLFVETNPAPAKWLLHRYGRLPSAHVRPPLCEVTASGQARILELADEADAVLRYEGLTERRPMSAGEVT
jgi:4-hydroxy-tetrahydrodipicolinate synthase